MKQRKTLRLMTAVLAALALLLSFAACRPVTEPDTTAPDETTAAADQGTTDAPETSQPESDAETESETAPAADGETTTNLPVADEAELRAGVWWAIGDGIDSYYEICRDGTGAVISQENGTGVGINYEVRGTGVTFQMGAVDAINEATLTATSADELTVTFADGRTEFWSYMGNVTMNGFTFYSNEQLCGMARDYIQAAEGYTPENVAATADFEDPRTINIQLYDNLGDHNSTAAWYFVDRFTAKGRDLNGNEIDLTAAP